MKKICFVILALTIVGFASCSNEDSNDEGAKAPTVHKPMVIIDPEARAFVNKAASAALYEIDLDRLAVKKGQDKRVKNFGNIMAKEHTKAMVKLTEIAEAKKIPMPTAVTADEQQHIDQLLENNGRAFDKAYMDEMAENHEQAIQLFTQASRNLMDPELRGFAGKNIGNLKRHLDAVNMIRASIK